MTIQSALREIAVKEGLGYDVNWTTRRVVKSRFYRDS